MKSILLIAGLVLSAPAMASGPATQTSIFADIQNTTVLPAVFAKQELIDMISTQNQEAKALALSTLAVLPTIELMPGQSENLSTMAKLAKPKKVITSE